MKYNVRFVAIGNFEVSELNDLFPPPRSLFDENKILDNLVIQLDINNLMWQHF